MTAADQESERVTVKKPQGILAGQLFGRGEAYLQAFDLMASDEAPLTFPACFVLSHAIELFLKSYLVAKNAEASLVKVMGHDLAELLASCKALGLADLANAEPFIRHIDYMNGDHTFRYPTDYRISVPGKRDCKEFMAVITREVRQVVDPIVARASLRLAANTRHLRPRKYIFADNPEPPLVTLRIPRELAEALKSPDGTWKRRALAILQTAAGVVDHQPSMA